ncbi:MAG TPA: TRAP transporter small permease subunit [Geminicoccaceae bacterium]
MGALRRACDLARRVLDGVIGTLLIAIVLITLAQVIARYLVMSSLVWSEELNRLLHLWLVMLAAAKASHLRIGLLGERLGGRIRTALDLGASLLSLALLALMIRGALRLAELTRFDMFTGLQVSMRWMFMAFVAGAAVWMLRIVVAGALALRR